MPNTQPGENKNARRLLNTKDGQFGQAKLAGVS
jgi:hypothetical protein